MRTCWSTRRSGLSAAAATPRPDQASDGQARSKSLYRTDAGSSPRTNAHLDRRTTGCSRFTRPDHRHLATATWPPSLGHRHLATVTWPPPAGPTPLDKLNYLADSRDMRRSRMSRWLDLLFRSLGPPP